MYIRTHRIHRWVERMGGKFFLKNMTTFLLWFIGLGLLCLPSARCLAQARCLWLNAATAGGILGGEVEMSVTPLTTAGDETCEFTRTDGTMMSMLRIEVHTMELPAKDFASSLSRCGGGTLPLKRIGNEAVQCLSMGSAQTAQEQVIGRVRERIFILTVRRKPAAIASKEALREDTRNTAEQIAGSLF
jgi:hypothetical protein